jgi:hypothetical protein
LAETFQGNEGNGADQPRRARSSTERSRAHRARKKLEREAALQAEREAALKAEAERVQGPLQVFPTPLHPSRTPLRMPLLDPLSRRRNVRLPRCLRRKRRNARPVQRKRQRSNALQATL